MLSLRELSVFVLCFYSCVVFVGYVGVAMVLRGGGIRGWFCLDFSVAFAGWFWGGLNFLVVCGFIWSTFSSDWLFWV